METSLRYSTDSKSLKIHAKEKFPLHSNTHFQVHAELDTRIGSPSYLSSMIRHYFPDLYAGIGVGVKYDRQQKLRYCVRGKKAFPVTVDSLVNFNIKGQTHFDKQFKQNKSSAATEFSWSIFNLKKDQDVRLKIGYEIIDKVTYFQIRENNWTLNADANGKWNVRYDL